MAHITCIRWHQNNNTNTVKVDIALKPSGQATAELHLPSDFADCFLKMCQLSADKLEQEMRAQILADAAKKPIHE